MPGITQEWKRFYTLIDTGAEVTCLHPSDALANIEIPLDDLSDESRWPVRDQRFGIGGQALYFTVDAVYSFLHEDGHWQEMPGQLRIAKPRPDNLMFPSLLGWDVLRHFEIKLNFSAGLVTLT